MLRVAHRLLLVLIAFAIVGGTTAQLARSAQSIAPMTMAGMPCDMMMPAASSERGEPMTPCKGMTPDCIKQMGCVADVALPARLANNEFVAHFTTVDYWSAMSELAELVNTPEPLPPRTV
jgi:hypothetical protein